LDALLTHNTLLTFRPFKALVTRVTFFSNVTGISGFPDQPLFTFSTF
jgi:hypothetical protein